MEQEIYTSLIADSSKIFDLDILEADLSVDNFFEHFQKKLAPLILELLKNDYSRLLNILYRVDVNEDIVRNCLEGPDILVISDSLARAITDRLIKKIKYRMENMKP